MKTKLITSGHYVPNNIITNDDLSLIVDTNDEWIYSRTGIKERRRVSEFEQASDMAYNASLDAINKIDYDVSKIDLIIVATISGDMITPSVANIIQGMLGIDEAMSFDINAACTGFVYALEMANALLKTKRFKAALVIGVEELTKLVNYNDRGTCILFGDGAGAAILETSNEGQEMLFYNSAKHDKLGNLTVDENMLAMDGPKVYIFAVDIIQKSINKILADNNMSIDDIDAIIPHQANIRIIQGVARAMKIDVNKFFTNIENYGNTSAASIPIALNEYRNAAGSGKRVLLVGFGGGFTWGSAILTT